MADFAPDAETRRLITERLSATRKDAVVSDEQARTMARALMGEDFEAIPAELAERVSAELTIPTIGIGAGAGCDGQVLVNQDMLGMFHDFTPKFVRRFAEVGDVMLEAYRAYDAAVKDGSFPAAEHTYAAPAGVLENL